MQAVGVYLRELRDAADLTQAEAAAHGGISSKTVERWEAGAVEPTLTDLAAYVRKLQGSVDELVKRLLGEDITRDAVVAEFAPQPGETPEETRRLNRLLDLLEAGVKPAEAARRVRSGE